MYMNLVCLPHLMDGVAKVLPLFLKQLCVGSETGDLSS